MGSLLAKWIYPHFHNDHRPSAIRHQSLFFFVILVALAQVVTNSIAGNPKILSYATNITKADIINLTNKERSSMGLPKVAESSLLSQAASLKAGDMLADNYWAHFAPDGTSPWYFFGEVGYQYSWAGENLARDFQTSAGVVAGWMASTAGHRENILNNNFTEIGIAVKNGILLGEETTLVIQLFAKPVSYTASAPTTPNTTQQGREVGVKDKLELPSGEEVSPVPGIESQGLVTDEGIRGEEGNQNNLAGMIENLSTSQKTSFGLLFVLGSLFAIDSATILRRRHQRTNSHSGAHISVIFILMITLIAQSVGSVL